MCQNKEKNFSKLPRISICVPTYNRSDLLRKTLASIKKQTIKPYEVIVADNCSEDDTEEVAKSFEGVIYYRNERNHGLAGNSNKCIQFASGDFVSILHSDDLISPYWHEYWLSAISRYQDTDIAVFFSSVFTIDSSDKVKIVYQEVLPIERVLGPGEAFKVLWSRNMCGLPASGGIIFRKSIFDEIGGYAEELSTEADALLVLRILNKYSIFHSPKFLYAFRVHPFQTFDKEKQEKTTDKKLSILVRHLKIFKDFYANELRSEYKNPMFYKRVVMVYLAIAFFHLITFKKNLASKYYKLTKSIFPEVLESPADYFVLATVILYYIKKLLVGKLLALPKRNMAKNWIEAKNK